MNAQEHAVKADELLGAIREAEGRIGALTPMEHLELSIAGGIKQHNESMEWSLELAKVHALTSLALRGIEGGWA